MGYFNHLLGHVAFPKPNEIPGLIMWHKASLGVTIEYQSLTTTTSIINAGDSSFTVNSATGLFQWMKIKIGTEEKVISSLSGTSVTVETPFASGYASGASLFRGRVSSWADQSGNNNHYTQSNVTYQPFYLTRALNAKPVLKFDIHHLISPVMSLTARTYVDIFQLKATSSGSYHGITTQNGAPWTQLYIGSHATNPQIVNNFINGTNYDMGLTLVNNTPVVMVNTMGPTQAQVRSNGSIGPVQTISLATANLPFWTGAANTPTNGPLNGEQSEKLVYNRVLTLDEITSLQNYAKNEYGLTF